MFKKADPGSLILHRVPHLRQAASWDCGVTCVLMLLDEPTRLRVQADLAFICAEEGFGQSTWTIDLCYMLQRFGIPHRMFTSSLGVNAAHRSLKYYSHIIDKDLARVSARFAGARAAGVGVWRGQLRCAELARHVRGGAGGAGGLTGGAGGPSGGAGGPALLLVNAALLDCDRCRRNKLRAELRRWFGAAYSGHYVVVVGHDSARDRFLYRDPARGPCPGPPHLRHRRSNSKSSDKICSQGFLSYKNIGLSSTNVIPTQVEGTDVVARVEGVRTEGSVPCVLRAARLLAAAAAPGTDHDVILIDRSYR